MVGDINNLRNLLHRRRLMSLKVKQTENGFIITEFEFRKKQRSWVCNSPAELASFMLGYYETDFIYAKEIRGEQ